MVENGSNRGTGALPPEEAHHEFLALCALATSGSLSAEEQKRLREHLSHCAACREVMAQYEVMLSSVIPALGPDPVDTASSEDFSWSLEEAEASLLARLEREDGKRQNPEGLSNQEKLVAGSPIKTVSLAGDSLWNHMWWQYAAGLLLLAALGFSVYRIGIRRGSESSPPIASIPTSAPVTFETHPEQRSNASKPLDAAQKDENASVAQLREQLEQKSAEIARLKASRSQIESDRNAKAADADRLSRERADLEQQLSTQQARLANLQQKLAVTTDQSAQNAAQTTSLEAKIGDLSDTLHDRDQEVARDQELLDHDRDIRELMGARDLYIAEVYDVAKTGDTEKPFGRVFYTKGKSLIFYAYDLDQQPGIRSASTFQAWGRRGPDSERAVNLGILYQDNASKKRWVLKSHDPKTLDQIDAVFVTVEPNGGSSHPSGKPFLFAYLKIGSNHP
jgi:hypothetical protein